MTETAVSTKPTQSQDRTIRKAAVLGSGVMGAAISAHLANAGIPNVLLDIAPGELSDAEKAKGLALDDPRVRNRIVKAGFDRARKSKPASFYHRGAAKLIRLGNFEDDLELLRDADWIVEAVIENLDIKKSLYERIAPVLKPGAILSSNTSGLSVAELSSVLPESLQESFLVTHFFNPPRYLKLLEIVPGPGTAPGVAEAMAEFGERVLGKGIVWGKDTPNFVANRVGVYSMMQALHVATEEGYSVAEVDAMTGRIIGRAKSATYRTADVVGVDTLMYVAANTHAALPDDPDRETFVPPSWVTKMVENGLLGQKSGAGFYRKGKSADGKKAILMIDPASGEYVEQPKVDFESLGAAKKIGDLRERLAFLVAQDDRAGQYLWKTISATLRYAANRVPEISDDLANVDNGMKWGFGWELGPFEIWDAIGVRASCERMKAEGHAIPAVAQALLDSGAESFYAHADGARRAFDPARNAHVALEVHPEILDLHALKESGKVVQRNDEATLIDLGDEVLCLEFHTKMNSIGAGIIDLAMRASEELERNWRGLVVGNQAPNFSAGANLGLILATAQEGNFGQICQIVRSFQGVGQAFRAARRPVVSAPHGLTLGGGCEISLGCDRVVAAAETYMGLPEVGVGVIPAGGGCKEMLKRMHQGVPEGADLLPLVQALFQVLGMAQVSTSAAEARELGFLRTGDRIVVNGDYVLFEAKKEVLAMDAAGYTPSPPATDIRVVGENGLAAIHTALHNMHEGRFITDYDFVVGQQLARVLCGGELAFGARVSEQFLLELEMQAFETLCRDERTLARMEHMLKTGKPLRN